jgi:septum formation protein
MPKIILASQSSRRRELLTQMGVVFDIVPSNFDEYLDDNRSPEEVAGELALGKAMTVAIEHPDCIVIGSDTIVTINGRQLEKPHDEAEAKELLKLLSGNENDVSTGLAVIWRDRDIQFVGADTAKVFFKPYNEQAVERYIATGDPMDKAGAYGVQSGAAPLINYIDGNYDTIVGLPTRLLAEFLAKLDVKADPVELVAPVENRISSR